MTQFTLIEVVPAPAPNRVGRISRVERAALIATWVVVIAGLALLAELTVFTGFALQLPAADSATIGRFVAAVLMFVVVWIWSHRQTRNQRPGTDWRNRWGDPALLTAPALLLVCMLCRHFVTWTPVVGGKGYHALTSPIDRRSVNIAFWYFAVLRYISAVCLARILPNPFRGPACGLLAAAILWLNPALLISSEAVWPIAIFLTAILLISINWWFPAGILLGFAGFFAQPLLLTAPIFLLAPLLAGWGRRFGYLLVGMVIAAGIVGLMSVTHIGPRIPPMQWQAISTTPEWAANLPAILEHRFAWREDEIATTLHLPGTVEISLGCVLWIGYGIVLLLCSIGAAIQLRRGSERLLVALIAPWVVLPLFVPNVPPGSVAAGAAMMAALVAVSTGISLLAPAFTVLACASLAVPILAANKTVAPMTLTMLRPAMPDIGWAALLFAGVLVFQSLVPGRRSCEPKRAP